MTAGDHDKSRQHVEVVPLSETSQDGNGGGHAGLVHIHLLEAALKSWVLLNVLAVLIQGGGTNAAQLATTQHGLQQIACTSKQAYSQQHTNLEQLSKSHLSFWGGQSSPLFPPGVKRVVKRRLGKGMIVQQHNALGIQEPGQSVPSYSRLRL